MKFNYSKTQMIKGDNDHRLTEHSHHPTENIAGRPRMLTPLCKITLGGKQLIIRMNTRMENYLSKLNINFKEEYLKCKPRHDILDSIKLYQIEDIILLDNDPRKVEEVDYEFLKKMFMDKTGYEAFMNHHHIEDFFQESISEEVKVNLAVMYIKVLVQRLKESWNLQQFIIIYSTNDEGDHTVRFYKYRKEEAPYLSDDIEGYELDSVMEITV